MSLTCFSFHRHFKEEPYTNRNLNHYDNFKSNQQYLVLGFLKSSKFGAGFALLVSRIELHNATEDGLE